MPVKIGEDLVLYDVEELASLFGVQEKTVRQLFRAGKLQGRKLARRWYTTEEHLRAYFDQQETDLEDGPDHDHTEPACL